MSGTHARLSASSAHRWLRCPGSIGGDGESSEYSAEGTFAHDIAAKCLQDASISPSDFLCKREKVDGFDVECGLEMVAGVQLYVDEMQDRTVPDDLCWVEMDLRTVLQKIDPDLGGTADYVRYRPSTKHLLVADFKYGAGMYVEVVDNEQAKVYALGALLEAQAHGFGVVEIEVVIVQPRFEGAAPVRAWSFKAVELLDFAADIKDAAAKSRLPNPPLVAGDHCKPFCPKRRNCPELEKRHHALIQADLGEIVDVKQISTLLASIPLVKARISAIEEHAYKLAAQGVEIPDFKLVDKIARRKWKSEGEVIVWAQANAIDPYAPREVLSPAQLEDKIKAAAPKGKKKEAVKVLEPFYEKVSSGTALVPITDDRPAVKRLSESDFAVIDGAAQPQAQSVVNLF